MKMLVGLRERTPSGSCFEVMLVLRDPHVRELRNFLGTATAGYMCCTPMPCWSHAGPASKKQIVDNRRWIKHAPIGPELNPTEYRGGQT